ncbi:MAG: hypothetical protein AB7P49_04610 [Bdellovibrionales bacterium]
MSETTYGNRGEKMRVLILDILQRPNGLFGRSPLFRQMGLGLEPAEFRQGMIRLYITPDPAEITVPMLRADIESRVPKSMVFDGEVPTLQGMRRRMWLDVTDEKIQCMMKSVDGTEVVCVMTLLIILLYLLFEIVNINSDLIL